MPLLLPGDHACLDSRGSFCKPSADVRLQLLRPSNNSDQWLSGNLQGLSPQIGAAEACPQLHGLSSYCALRLFTWQAAVAGPFSYPNPLYNTHAFCWFRSFGESCIVRGTSSATMTPSPGPNSFPKAFPSNTIPLKVQVREDSTNMESITVTLRQPYYFL